MSDVPLFLFFPSTTVHSLFCHSFLAIWKYVHLEIYFKKNLACKRWGAHVRLGSLCKYQIPNLQRNVTYPVTDPFILKDISTTTFFALEQFLLTTLEGTSDSYPRIGSYEQFVSKNLIWRFFLRNYVITLSLPSCITQLFVMVFEYKILYRLICLFKPRLSSKTVIQSLNTFRICSKQNENSLLICFMF